MAISSMRFAGCLLFLLRVEFHGACVLSLLQGCLISLEHTHFHLGVFVSCLCHLLLLAQSRLYGLQVFELQLGVDYLLVAHGVYRSVHVCDVVVVETAQHVDDGVGLTDVSEEFVSESFALACSLHESGDVYYLAGSGNDASRMNYLGKLSKSLVRYCDYAHIRLDCTEREVGCLCLSIRKAVEKSGLAHVRESNDTTF